MDAACITKYIRDTFSGVEVLIASEETGSPEIAWGDTFFHYGADRRWPFATIVTKDYGDFDCASNLNRPGVFRLNIGVSKETFRKLFGSQAFSSTATESNSPKSNDAAESGYDFAALDQIMPHPVYG